MRPRSACRVLAAAGLLSGCGGDPSEATGGVMPTSAGVAPTESGSSGGPAQATGETTGGDSAGTESSGALPEPGEGSESGGSTEPPNPGAVSCGSPAPAGAPEPATLPTYSSGTCPSLVPGWNTLTSSGDDRELLIVAPTDWSPDETLPVAFLWHWLGGSPEGFAEQADVQNAVDQLRFLAIIPAEKGDLPFRWPFSLADSEARLQEEFVFFDDMLACAAQSFSIDRSCVSSVGVSAGALFTGQLGWGRSDYLSSIISLSGGTGGELIKPWRGATHIMPALVLWGGPQDTCIALNFENTSADLAGQLLSDGHVVLECEHNCGHAAPPFESGDPEVTPFAGMWQFILDHPYWLEPGQTPWSEGTPSTLPQWCSLGVGSSTPRVGACADAPGC